MRPLLVLAIVSAAAVAGAGDRNVRYALRTPPIGRTARPTVLVNEAAVGGPTKASIVLLAHAATKGSWHSHPGEEALIVLDGRARLEDTELGAGDAVWFAAGEAHGPLTDAAGAIVLQVFAPAGPERVYDGAGAGATTVVPAPSRKPAHHLVRAASLQPRVLAGGFGAVKTYFAEVPASFTIRVLDAPRGTRIAHAASDGDEFLYITAGGVRADAPLPAIALGARGMANAGNEISELAPGDVLHVPAGDAYAVTATRPLHAIVISSTKKP